MFRNILLISYTYKLLHSAFLVLLLCACATQPYEQDLYAEFLKNSTIEKAQFKHRVLFIKQENSKLSSKTNNSTDANQKLSIFIEGDGTPWHQEKYVKKDPSPQTLLMFEAMQYVKGNKLYIGRPCYFQTNDPNCHYRYWTSHRYGNEVIQSMRDVLLKHIQGYEHIVFVGHSGGGTLATLLACERQAPHIKSSTLITLSANLDTDKWTDHHNWSRMTGSLNPAELLKDCSRTSQYHYLGKEDLNVPYTLNNNYFKQQGITPIIYDDADHNNWLRFWPEIIRSNPFLNSAEKPKPDQAP